jgi:hypothetical protein
MDIMTRITDKTWIPLGLMSAAMSIAVGGAWSASSFYSRLAQAETQIVDLKSSQLQMLAELKKINENMIEIKIIVKGENKK